MDLNKINYIHVVSSVYKVDKQLTNYVYGIYKKSAYIAMYEKVVYPVPMPQLWKKSNKIPFKGPKTNMRLLVDLKRL